MAQNKAILPASKVKKVNVKGDRFMIVNGTLVYYIPRDTVIYVADTVDILIKKQDIKRTEAFYDSVEIKMSKSKVSSLVYDLLFVDPDNKPHGEVSSERRFNQFKGSRIKSIEHKPLAIFGTKMQDTSYYRPSKYSEIFNKTHVNTREFIVRKNILFEEGDKINAEDLVESERLLRRLEFIKDARVMIDESRGKRANVSVVTKDVFPYNIQINPDNGNNAIVGLSHINIGGIGHQLEFDYVKWQEYELFYTVPNIEGTFVDAKLDYSHHFKKTGIGVRLDRAFVTQQTQFGGGTELSRFEFGELDYDRQLDVNNEFYYKRIRKDIWLGRSFLTNIHIKHLGFNDKTYAVVSGRVDNQDFFDKPVVRMDTNYVYHDRTTTLVGIGLTSREYYKDKFILNYGRTEDIPTGTALSIVMGYEKREFENRNYLGVTYARGGYIRGFGYLNGIYSIGAFTSKDGFKDGVASLKLDYFSTLNQFGQYKYRQFVSLSFAQTIRPTEDIFLRGQQQIGIRGLESYYLKATSKINLKTEALLFTPLTFVGFRTATFAFFDATTTFNAQDSYFKPTVFYGTGLGFRLRNDNLAISTIQIRFGLFPNQPVNAYPQYIQLSTTPTLGIRDFDFKAPTIVPFN